MINQNLIAELWLWIPMGAPTQFDIMSHEPLSHFQWIFRNSPMLKGRCGSTRGSQSRKWRLKRKFRITSKHQNILIIWERRNKNYCLGWLVHLNKIKFLEKFVQFFEVCLRGVIDFCLLLFSFTNCFFVFLLREDNSSNLNSIIHDQSEWKTFKMSSRSKQKHFTNNNNKNTPDLNATVNLVNPQW